MAKKKVDPIEVEDIENDIENTEGTVLTTDIADYKGEGTVIRMDNAGQYVISDKTHGNQVCEVVDFKKNNETFKTLRLPENDSMRQWYKMDRLPENFNADSAPVVLTFKARTTHQRATGFKKNPLESYIPADVRDEYDTMIADAKTAFDAKKEENFNNKELNELEYKAALADWQAKKYDAEAKGKAFNIERPTRGKVAGLDFTDFIADIDRYNEILEMASEAKKSAPKASRKVDPAKKSERASTRADKLRAEYEAKKAELGL